jgi:hypothetical protein
VQEFARDAYKTFQQNPHDPSLHFKLVKGTTDQYSIRVSHAYRALGKMPDSNTIVWYWIGSHSDYINLIP